MRGVSECSNFQCGGSNVQFAECRSILKEGSSEATGDSWKCWASQGLIAGTGSVAVASKSKVSCDQLGVMMWK